MDRVIYALNSAQDAKAACMSLLSQPVKNLGGLKALELSEGRQFLSQCYYLELQSGASESYYGAHYPQLAPHQAIYQRGPSTTSTVSTLDFTEVLLAAACSCGALQSVHVGKTVLLDSEAGAIARLGARVKELFLTTNSSARPLRRPLVELMLTQMTGLTDLRLSYIRDTTADMAKTLPALSALTRLELSYACFGNSGAGQHIMEAVAKHQADLQQLKLHECGVDDGMLNAIMHVRSLTSLHVQDEDAPEESHPTNQGLVRITGLLRLQRLELFGEELRLDPELLASLARLPALAHLSMAGLDALHVPLMSDLSQQRGPGSSGHCALPHNRDAACTRCAPRCAGMAGGGACTCGGDLEDMEASSSSAGDVHDVADDDDESSSSMSMEDVTSRHVVACMSPRGGAGGEEEGEGGPRMNMPLHPSIPRPCYSVREPLQQLTALTSLVLYGPASLRVFPPPLSLLLPQPALKALKLSACASAANLRALAYQRGLTKLTLSHSAVVDLYPETSASATDVVEESSAPSHALGQEGQVAGQQGLVAGTFCTDAYAPSSPFMHPPTHSHEESGQLHAHSGTKLHQLPAGLMQVELPGDGSGMQLQAYSGPPTLARVQMCVLGYGPEVSTGLADLTVLRIKDLPGFSDVHLVDLIAALACLPALSELKLRSLPGVGSAALGYLPRLQRLQRLKLYALGSGVCNAGIVGAVAAMPCLCELKVKGCEGVGPGLAQQVAEARAQVLGQGAACSRPCVVRYGMGECGGSAEAKEQGLAVMAAMTARTMHNTTYGFPLYAHAHPHAHAHARGAGGGYY